jgi:hypothetical protein
VGDNLRNAESGENHLAKHNVAGLAVMIWRVANHRAPGAEEEGERGSSILIQVGEEDWGG